MPFIEFLIVAQIAAASPVPPAIRINQLGYLPDAPKVAVFCALEKVELSEFAVTDLAGNAVLRRPATPAKPFGPCVVNYRLDFSSLKQSGDYRISAGGVTSPVVRIRQNAYAGAADTLLYYMREQRSGFNPFFKTVVHIRDGIVVDDSARAGKFVPVTGGWADASDYLQYVTTSANATFVMLMAYRDHAASFADKFDARGLAGSNGVAGRARRSASWSQLAPPHVPLGLRDVQPARRRPRSRLLGSSANRFVRLRLGQREGTARVSVHRQAAGTVQEQEPIRRARVDGRQVRVGVRARRVHLQEERSGLCQEAPAEGARGVLARARNSPASARPRRAARLTSTRKTTGSTTWSSAPPSSTR